MSKSKFAILLVGLLSSYVVGSAIYHYLIIPGMGVLFVLNLFVATEQLIIIITPIIIGQMAKSVVQIFLLAYSGTIGILLIHDVIVMKGFGNRIDSIILLKEWDLFQVSAIFLTSIPILLLMFLGYLRANFERFYDV